MCKKKKVKFVHNFIMEVPSLNECFVDICFTVDFTNLLHFAFEV